MLTILDKFTANITILFFITLQLVKKCSLFTVHCSLFTVQKKPVKVSIFSLFPGNISTLSIKISLKNCVRLI